ncbi:LAQU0S01e09252g1_1 [Lachancea quebecensis]|uniref:LAQU0S01e09252g1_1 n=1 Tax=Lachancea quebecensis TaxID=1654605 RepID=A0A0P1KLL2_9SACH|nr:LAQU0S01e09252g1_1 [Lachancea quebecensis]
MAWRLSLNSLGKRLNSDWSRLSKIYERASYKVPDKLPLLQNEASHKIRCGVILQSLKSQRQSAFLSALLSDVYSSDQYWHEQFSQRYSKPGFKLIRYGASLEIHKLDNSNTLYTLPSPWLQKHDIELLEMDEVNPANDGCHVYLGLEKTFPTTAWPTLSITDTDSESPMGPREVNCKKALAGMQKLIQSKSNVNEYLKDLESSNFLCISRLLESQFCDKSLIMKRLKHAVIKNIYETDTSISKFSQQLIEKKNINEEIDNWAYEAHLALQSQLKPSLTQFVHDQLSVFRLHTYSESQLELKLREMCDLSGTSDMTEKINYIRGRLHLPLFSPPVWNMNRLYQRADVMHKVINKFIYQQFFKLQLPLILCSVVGVLSGQFTAYSMGSLATLGIVLGVNRTMNKWSEILQRFQSDVLEEKRLEIEAARREIQTESNIKIKDENQIQHSKIEILERLSK